jgi:uncharacterized cupredoxin-like copper-binding protein
MKARQFVVGGIALVASGALLFAPAAGAARKATTVTVTAGKPSEFRFILSKKAFPHGTVTFKLTNAGTQPHDLKICASPKGGNANSCAGTGTKQLSPGQSATLVYTFKSKGVYEYLCTVPGHAAAGMKGTLRVA